MFLHHGILVFSPGFKPSRHERVIKAYLHLEDSERKVKNNKFSKKGFLNLKLLYWELSFCRGFSFLKLIYSTENFETKLRTFQWFYRFPQSKFESNKSKGSWVFIEHPKKYTNRDYYFIYIDNTKRNLQRL